MILRKASELASPPDGARRSEPGFSLAEIKAIATEVGIDPANVERAARLVAADRGQSVLERVIGGPLQHRRDFLVSRLLSEAEASRLLTAIRVAAEQHGEGEANESGVSWSSKGEPSRVFVSAFPERGGTRVQIGVDRTGGLLLTGFVNLTGGVVIASIVGAVIEPNSLATGAAILGAGIAGGLTLGRAVWATTTKRVRVRVDRLVEVISGSLEGGSTSAR